MNMPTEPQQDRNVEARASELLPCPFCPPELSKPEWTVRYSYIRAYISGKLCSIRCQRCNSQSGEFHTEAEAIAAWNSRPSQPPQNVEAGDAVRGMVEEIEQIRRQLDRAAQMTCDGKPEPEVWKVHNAARSAAFNLLMSDRLRLALSATGDDARVGELAVPERVASAVITDFLDSISETQIASLSGPFDTRDARRILNYLKQRAVSQTPGDERQG